MDKRGTTIDSIQGVRPREPVTTDNGIPARLCLIQAITYVGGIEQQRVMERTGITKATGITPDPSKMSTKYIMKHGWKKTAVAERPPSF